MKNFKKTGKKHMEKDISMGQNLDKYPPMDVYRTPYRQYTIPLYRGTEKKGYYIYEEFQKDGERY